METLLKSDAVSGMRVFRYRLKNGSRCYVFPKEGCTVGYAAAVVDAGSSDTHAVVTVKKLFSLWEQHIFLNIKCLKKKTLNVRRSLQKLVLM